MIEKVIFSFLIVLSFSAPTALINAAPMNTAPGTTLPKVVGGDPKKPLEKIPKSLFLVKKIKVSPDVGEPQFNPQEAQLRTVINDPVLHNTKKFE